MLIDTYSLLYPYYYNLFSFSLRSKGDEFLAELCPKELYDGFLFICMPGNILLILYSPYIKAFRSALLRAISLSVIIDVTL